MATDVLWPDLINSWELAHDEVDYINRQQGLQCRGCGSNLRSMALAQSIVDSHDSRLKLPYLMATRPWRRILEINTAGNLTRFLRFAPRHQLVEFPDIDMQDLPFPDGSFDLVVHSDTLEHVPDPTQGLRETLRVLRPGGLTCFTVPIVIGRLTRSREGLPGSFHGTAASPEQFEVHTEYGADAWLPVLEAGFTNCTMRAFELPGGLAVSARRPRRSPPVLASLP